MKVLVKKNIGQEPRISWKNIPGLTGLLKMDMKKYCLWMNDDGTSCPVEVDYKSGQYYCPVHKVEREKMLKKHSFRGVRVSSYDLGKAERGEHGS